VLRAAIQQLDEYFAGQRTSFDLPLDMHAGTPFQQQVWQALLGIAPGATASYGSLSAAIGKPAAVRALGAAVGRNPISIVVPCHRVIRASGETGQYRWGAERKAQMLAWETRQLADSNAAR